jgi:hypothetical protein
MRTMDMPGPAPAFTLLLSINAPVTLVRILYRPLFLPDPWDDIILIVAIGLFWYYVALNINSWRERRTLLLFAWAPLRIATDLIMIALGACLGLFCILAANTSPYTPFSALAWPWFIPTWASLLLWSLGSVLVFGRDLIHYFLRKSPQTTSSAQA